MYEIILTRSDLEALSKDDYQKLAESIARAEHFRRMEVAKHPHQQVIAENNIRELATCYAAERLSTYPVGEHEIQRDMERVRYEIENRAKNNDWYYAMNIFATANRVGEVQVPVTDDFVIPAHRDVISIGDAPRPDEINVRRGAAVTAFPTRAAG